MITLSNIYSLLDKKDNMIFALVYSVTVQPDGSVHFKSIDRVHDYKRKSFVNDDAFQSSPYLEQLCLDHLPSVNWKEIAIEEQKEWPTAPQFPRVDLDHEAYREQQEDREEQQMNDYFDQSNEQL